MTSAMNSPVSYSVRCTGNTDTAKQERMITTRLKSLLRRRDELVSLLQFYRSTKSDEKKCLQQILEELDALEREIAELRMREELSAVRVRVLTEEEILRQGRSRL